MAAKLSEVIAEARVILQDKRAPYRYTDDEMLAGVRDSLREVLRMRPDLFVIHGYKVPAVNTANQDFPIEESTFRLVVFLTAAYAMIRDDEFSEDGRAAQLQGAAVTGLKRG